MMCEETWDTTYTHITKETGKRSLLEIGSIGFVLIFRVDILSLE